MNLDVVGGANDYLVEFIPEGNVVEGIHYYEEGTDVQLRALNNRILTFTNWEDNTTQLERIITMDGEKNLTANYSCEDYIVAWDFYRKSPTSDRAADYKAESDNAGLLTLRKLDGSTTGWLGAGTDEGAVYLEGNAVRGKIVRKNIISKYLSGQKSIPTSNSLPKWVRIT